jgi:hypothetical protein
MSKTGCQWRAYDAWYREFHEYANWDLATVLLAVRDVLHRRGLLKPDDDDRFEQVAGEIACRREPTLSESARRYRCERAPVPPL